MYVPALATDYDGTIVEHGGVNETTIAALEQIRESGRKLISSPGASCRTCSGCSTGSPCSPSP